MLPALSMACKGTGTIPQRKQAWSRHMASSPLGSKMATLAPGGSSDAINALDQSATL